MQKTRKKYMLLIFFITILIISISCVNAKNIQNTTSTKTVKKTIDKTSTDTKKVKNNEKIIVYYLT